MGPVPCTRWRGRPERTHHVDDMSRDARDNGSAVDGSGLFLARLTLGEASVARIVGGELRQWGTAMKRSLVLATILATGLWGSVRAQPAPITLRLADVYPVGHNVSEGTAKFFMEEVRRRSNGAVNFEYYPAEQLGKGKDMLQLTLSGVTDIGLVVPSYISDKMPLSAVAELPGGYATSCQGSLAFWQLTHSGALDRLEFAPNHVHVLMAHTLNPYQVFSARRIHSLDDLRGQKMRSLGALMDLTIQKLGGVPLHIAAPDIHEAMSRGTIDGGVLAVVSIASYKLTPLLKFGTVGENFGSAALDYAISDARWRQLSPDVQQAMAKAGEDVMESSCQGVDDSNNGEIEAMKTAGIAITALPQAEHDKLAVKLASVGRDWATTLDGRGKPGSAVLADFLAALHETHATQ
jgi:TRAP-type C4-dicarboxylate transport system substrate-binding protein